MSVNECGEINLCLIHITYYDYYLVKPKSFFPWTICFTYLIDVIEYWWHSFIFMLIFFTITMIIQALEERNNVSETEEINTG